MLHLVCVLYYVCNGGRPNLTKIRCSNKAVSHPNLSEKEREIERDQLHHFAKSLSGTVKVAETVLFKQCLASHALIPMSRRSGCGTICKDLSLTTLLYLDSKIQVVIRSKPFLLLDKDDVMM